MTVSSFRPFHPPSSSTPTSMLGSLALALACALPSGCFDPAPLEVQDEASDTGSGDDAGEGESSSAGDDPDGSGTEALPVCGDGIVEGDEVCDDGLNDGAYGGCSADCDALGPHCGDGRVDADEACDDGDAIDGNGCNTDCVVSGSELWTRFYDGPEHGSDWGAGVAVDDDDQIVVSANTVSGINRGMLRKYSIDGDVLWSRTLVGSQAGESEDENGGVLTLGDAIVLEGGSEPGGSDLGGSGFQEVWLRSFDSSGEEGWTRVHDGAVYGTDLIRGLGIDSEHHIYVLIEEGGSALQLPERHVLRKYSAEGEEIWTRTFEGGWILGLTIDGHDHPIVRGHSYHDADAAWVQKLDTEGAEVWNRSIPSASSMESFITSSHEGEIAVSVSPQGADPRVLRLDSSGEIIGELFPPVQGDRSLLSAGAYDDEGNLVLGGATITGTQSGAAAVAWISKISSDGEDLWTRTIDGEFDSSPSWDMISAVAIDSHANVIVTGTIHRSPDQLGDLIVAKYAP